MWCHSRLFKVKIFLMSTACAAYPQRLQKQSYYRQGPTYFMAKQSHFYSFVPARIALFRHFSVTPPLSTDWQRSRPSVLIGGGKNEGAAAILTASCLLSGPALSADWQRGPIGGGGQAPSCLVPHHATLPAGTFPSWASWDPA